MPTRVRLGSHPPVRARRLIACVAAAAVLTLLGGTAPREAAAQPVAYGSADDPWEVVQQLWWRRESTLSMRGGIALIGPQWFAGSTLSAALLTRPVTARLEATVYANTLGTYAPLFDEPYDALRTLDFARYNPPAGVPVHLRLGPLERVRLGFTGHLADFFSTRAAWDERTVGAEVYAATPVGTLSAFTDNLFVDGALGLHLAARPFGRWPQPRLASIEVGLSALTDAGTWDADTRLAALAAEARLDLFSAGSVRLSPFASYATYLDHGAGLATGVDFHSLNFADVARFRVRLALFYNGDRFIPGYAGPFYTVSSHAARILHSDTPFDPGAPRFAGIVIDEASGGPDLVTELRMLLFERFELWYSFRRHYGSQRLSTMNLRLFVRAPGGFRFQIAQDRAGLEDFNDLFAPLNEQTSFVFRADYPFTRRLWLYLRGRYTFEHVGRTAQGTELFLEQRRFEPSVGYRVFF